ncbi:single-stranded-DNA-specific exonuclease RecJ [Bacillus piscicola]|uniref:single-stranded-DNA-specific exonuclease RecJ n=1 Tax=Bacillus piscicola TaxID=1632684 RepID=UPI001F08A934|nr:single-stranded-DNA-specific exonuclease RecJ [Bacillus piscicola]
MLRAKTNWERLDGSLSGHEQLQNELSLSSITAKLLWNRGYRDIQTAKEFLQTDKNKMHDPFLLDGMELAVHRIKQALTNKEKILIFGDYDADGVSSTAIMINLLKELEAEFGWYIPNRFTEGYGPNIPALQLAKEEGASLVITVDTGIAAVAEIEAANEMGLDVIVTDHHEPPPALPAAFSIINPKKPQCPYPFKELAGAGVALKVAHALLGFFPEHLLDLYTIGTVSDLVPLVDENRILVKEGLKLLTHSSKPGVRALKECCGIEGEEVNEEHVGFSIGPRINAAGRMDSADPAVHLLTAETAAEAREWVQVIDDYNKKRQKVVNEITTEAIDEVNKIFSDDETKVIVVGKEGWNPGVIGIAASRLTEKFYRPVIVLAIDSESGEAKGSARSIEGFNMYEQLSENRDILPRFGGHQMAAGLTMKAADIELLRQRLQQQAETVLDEKALVPVTKIDMAIPIQDATLQALEEMKNLAPFGVGNPKPIFLIENVELASKRKIGSEKNHFKAEWESQTTRLDCVGFHLGYLDDHLTERTTASVIGELAINEWNGFRKPQLFLKDVEVREWQLYDQRQQKDLKAYIHQLPDTSTAVLAFKKSTCDRLKDDVTAPVLLFENEEYAKEQLPVINQLVIVDMPPSLEALKKALTTLTELERIHVFFEEENQVYFQPTPTRDEFKWYYAFLKKREAFNIKELGNELARRKGWHPSVVQLMTKVFFELEFVTIKDNIVTVNQSPLKKDLTEAPSYQKHLNQKQAEEALLYSTYSQLKQIMTPFVSKKSRENRMKEKVGNGL